MAKSAHASPCALCTASQFQSSFNLASMEQTLELSFEIMRWGLWRWICGSFFLWLSFSCYQVVTNKSSNDTFFHSKWRLRTKWRRFSENFIVLNKKSCHLTTFWRRLESKRTRARGKRNHKFHASVFDLCPQCNGVKSFIEEYSCFRPSVFHEISI